MAAAAAPTYAAVVAAPPSGAGGQLQTGTAASNALQASSGGSASGQEVAKTLRAKLERLRSAKAALGGDAACESAGKQLDAEIAGAQSQLAACLPVEVAVKGTIAPAAQARQAVVRSEAKLAKLEGHIAALMAAHDQATAELADNRAKLVEAEAATARAAAVALPRSDVDALLANDPGAVWSALVSFIKARVPGMPAEFVAHLGAATDAFQSACSQLPAAPHPSAAAAADAPLVQRGPVQPGGAASAPTSGSPLPALLVPSSPVVHSQFEADVAAAAAAEAAAAAAAAGAAAAFQQQQAQHQLQHQHPHQQQHQQQHRQQAATEATSAASAGAIGTAVGPGPADATTGLEAIAAAAIHQAAVAGAPGVGGVTGVGAGLGSSLGTDSAPPAHRVPVGDGLVRGGAVNDDNDVDLADAAPLNDSMGGAANDGVVGKRPIQDTEDAVERARAVAAKAKARAV